MCLHFVASSTPEIIPFPTRSSPHSSGFIMLTSYFSRTQGAPNPCKGRVAKLEMFMKLSGPSCFSLL